MAGEGDAVRGRVGGEPKGSAPTHGILGSDQDVVGRLSPVPIDVLGDAQLPGLRADVEEGVLVQGVEAVRQRVEQRSELRAVRIRGNNLSKEVAALCIIWSFF